MEYERQSTVEKKLLFPVDTPIEQVEVNTSSTEDINITNEASLQANVEAKPTNSISYRYGGFWMRFWAYLVDLIVIGSMVRLVINPVFRLLDVSLYEDNLFAPITIVGAVVFYSYFVLMTKFFGQTIGKMIFGLKVVTLSGKPLSWSTVLFREWIGRFISIWGWNLLYIVVAFTEKKQAIHDMFVETTVIHE